MAQEATANEQKKFKVPRIPGDIMIYPMIVGLLLNTFCPQVFEIGGFFTAACRGGSNTIVAAILLFVGAGISFKSTPGAIKTGIVVLIPKLVVAAALGLGVAYFFNDNLLGLSSVSIIGGITFCNMALYTGIMGEFGDESEQGAVGILFFTAGPAVTMIILGVSGLANIPLGTIVGSINGPDGATLAYTSRYAEQLEAAYASIPETNRYMVIVGFPTVAQGLSFMKLEDWDERERSQFEIRDELLPKLQDIPGVRAFPINRPPLGQSARNQPVNFVIRSSLEYAELQPYVEQLLAEVRDYPGLESLDSDLKGELLNLVTGVIAADATAVLYVTHEEDEARVVGGTRLYLACGRLGSQT